MRKQTRIIGAYFLIFSYLLFSGLARADNEISRDFRIDGSVDPTGIPDWYKARELFKYYRGELDDQLDVGEKIVVLKYVREISWLEGVHFALSTPQMHSNVCPMLDGDADAIEIARVIDRQDDKNELQFKQIYDMFRAKIGDSGGEKILELADQKVTPKLVYERRSRTHLAADDPSVYVSNLKNFCANSFLGELSIVEELRGKRSRTITKKIR